MNRELKPEKKYVVKRLKEKKNDNTVKNKNDTGQEADRKYKSPTLKEKVLNTQADKTKNELDLIENVKSKVLEPEDSQTSNHSEP